VFDYYNQTSTLDRWERVVNWLEGFQRAIKDLIKRQRIQEEINFYKSLQPKEEKSLTIQEQDFKKYSLKERVDLWKDLFNTNKKWLMNGYFHKECNLFLDSLFSSFEIEVKPSYQKLLILRGLKPKINNHNFFF
jgi:hydroxymethylpyrimidine pyrophosphatase-like HAD family hydrolase